MSSSAITYYKENGIILTNPGLDNSKPKIYEELNLQDLEDIYGLEKLRLEQESNQKILDDLLN